MSAFTPTPLEKFVTRTRLSWLGFVIIAGAVLLLLPFAVAYLDGFLDAFLYEGGWRTLLLSPAIVIYILALQAPMRRYQQGAIDVFQSLVRLEDEAFDQLVRSASDVDDRAEAIAFGVGALFGLWAYAPWKVTSEYFWLKIYFPLAGALMFGFLSWIIVATIASTNLQATLHKQELEIDIFDIQPFEPIGRYSLFEALAFVGGSALSVLFVNPLGEGADIGSLVVYGILGVVALLVFFLGMRHTHRVLADAKAKELREVRRNIAATLRRLNNEEDNPGSFGEISTELNLWTRYEERLKGTRTWPYNTAMLRTIVVSALLPALASVVQRVLASLFFS
jgi:hypothetical protein